MRILKNPPTGLRLCHGWLALAAVSCLLACDTEPLELTADGTAVVVPDRYRGCAVDDDCTLVNISCDGCCDRDAVAKSREKEFESTRKDVCSGYQGPECDCELDKLDARCKNQRCVAVPTAAE